MPVLTKGMNEGNNVDEDSLASVIRSMRKVCEPSHTGVVTKFID